MILPNGTELLVAHRHLFQSDHQRFFLGVVEGYEAGVARVTGHSWTRAGYRGQFHEQADALTEILSLPSGTYFVYQLASTLDLSSARIVSEGLDVALRDDRLPDGPG